MKNGLLLEETLVATLKAAEGLSGRVCPILDIQKSTGPLAVFEQQDESEDKDIDGLTGLCVAVYKIHALHRSYTQMRLLAEQIKNAIQNMKRNADISLCIEDVTISMASPDLYEDRVCLFRRTYKVTIHYQIKEEM